MKPLPVKHHHVPNETHHAKLIPLTPTHPCQETMPITKIFSYLVKALGGSFNPLTSAYKATSATPSVYKRSARLRIKKAKALGMDIATLSDQDILFINSLTLGDIATMGVKCGEQIPTHTLEDAASRLKSIELYHCKLMSVEVVQVRAI